jgi:CheY-like chemotaxis protein
MTSRNTGMDGYEATRQIRKSNKNVIIIAQTAYVLEGEREKAIEAGCNDYISKPINLIKLKEMILKHLKMNKTALIEELN